MTIGEAYEKYCETRFPPTNEIEVASFEEEIGAALPPHFRDYLLEYNGGYFNELVFIPADDGCPKCWLNAMYGFNAPHDFALFGKQADIWFCDDYVPSRPPELIPIGNTAMNHLILLDLDPAPENYGMLYLRTFDESFWLAEDMDEFFELLEDETRSH